MTRLEKANDFLDGCCMVEYGGNYYEYIGDKDGKLMLSDVNDGYCITKSFDELLEDEEFEFVY